MNHTRRQVGQLLAIGAGLGIGLPPLAARAQAADAQSPPANVFISPCGQPFRAREGAPYPVVDWFKLADKNADGRLVRAELVSDAERFFNALDRDGDGVLSPHEVSFYEQRIAPEILGFRVEVRGTDSLEMSRRPRLWRVQMAPPEEPMNPGAGAPDFSPTPRSPHVLDESGAGASPFSFFDEPEPLMAADLSFRGVVRKADFLKLADAHFTALDPAGVGYLTLETLPKTPMQKRLEHTRRRR